jgi:chromosome segregation ATPase
MTTKPDTEITFDKNSGISREEQQEILEKINNITEKNRLSLSAGAEASSKKSSKWRVKATKSGGLFPVMVNIMAIAALAGGGYALYLFQGKTGAQIREGVKVYNSAERALIDEIRKETSFRLEAKENEITLIVSKLESVDTELSRLYSGNKELTAEQQASENRLKSMQEEYRSVLTQLQDEPSRILEEARAREASLQAQLESRTRELALVSEQSAAAVDLARSELERLSGEQAQAAAIEAQMGALFASLNTMISENRLDAATETIGSMRSFLNTPAFQSLRSIQARKELYVQALNSFETMIPETRKDQKALATGVMPTDKEVEKLLTDLQEENERFKKEIEDKDKAITDKDKTITDRNKTIADKDKAIADKDRTLATVTSQGDGMARRVGELETSLSTLRRERDTQVRSLETEKETLNQTVTARNATINNIQNVIQGKAITDMTVGELSESLARIQAALQPSP